MLLDANALLLLVRARFPLSAELERIHSGSQVRVPSSVIEEVDRLAERGIRGARAAAALARSFPIARVVGRGDDAILEYATREGSWVVTADRALAKRLHNEGVDVLVPRDRHRLELRRGARSRAGPAEPPTGGRVRPRRQRL